MKDRGGQQSLLCLLALCSPSGGHQLPAADKQILADSILLKLFCPLLLVLSFLLLQLRFLFFLLGLHLLVEIALGGSVLLLALRFVFFHLGLLPLVFSLHLLTLSLLMVLHGLALGFVLGLHLLLLGLLISLHILTFGIKVVAKCRWGNE